MKNRRETQREMQSRRGSCPPRAMAAMDQWENPPPIYGGGQARRRRRGALPLLFRCCRSSTGEIIVTAIYTNNSMQWCNLSVPVVIMYLNMVLNSICYYPMMCGNHIM